MFDTGIGEVLNVHGEVDATDGVLAPVQLQAQEPQRLEGFIPAKERSPLVFCKNRENSGSPPLKGNVGLTDSPWRVGTDWD